MRIIKSMEDQYLQSSAELVEAVFTASESAEDGKLVRSLVEEIRGFVTSAPYWIVAHESVGLPAEECLMVKELVPGALAQIHGTVSYSDYKSLQ